MGKAVRRTGRSGLTRMLAEKDKDEACWVSKHVVVWMSVTQMIPPPLHSAHTSPLADVFIGGTVKVTCDHELSLVVFFFFMLVSL